MNKSKPNYERAASRAAPAAIEMGPSGLVRHRLAGRPEAVSVVPFDPLGGGSYSLQLFVTSVPAFQDYEAFGGWEPADAVEWALRGVEQPGIFRAAQPTFWLPNSLMGTRAAQQRLGQAFADWAHNRSLQAAWRAWSFPTEETPAGATAVATGPRPGSAGRYSYFVGYEPWDPADPATWVGAEAEMADA